MEWINVVFWLAGTLIVVLGPIILVHELGHFILAKWAGVRVEEFGFGFPPRLSKLWRGKGDFSIGNVRTIIPAGFRLPPGLRVGARVDATVQRSEDGAYLLRRLIVHDPRDPIEGTTSGPERADEGLADEGLHLRGEVTEMEPGTLYSLNLLPMGAFVKLTGEEDPTDQRSLAAQPKRWRVAVLAAGAVLNIILALMLITGAYASGYPEKWVVQVSQIEPGSPAEAVGLQPRDVILAAGGERIEEGMAQLQQIIRGMAEQPVELAVLRGREALTFMATPERTPEGYGRLGIWMASWPDRSALRHYRLPGALQAGIADIGTAIAMTVQMPARLAKGEITPQEARPASVVGISGVLAFTLQQSIAWGLPFPVLQTAALISLALGLTNLLPLPALDGGRILFVLIEAVRGRRVSAEHEAMVHFIGLVVLVSLMGFVMLQDFINPIIPWSWLR
jgi:regulator of sigma E protease